MMAESSAQALERFLAEQLKGLGLDVPDAEVEYMARFVEEEGLEQDEKVEGVRGMLEGVVEAIPENFESAITATISKWIELSTVPASPTPSASPEPEPEPELQLTEKEIAKLHALRYAYSEADPAELAAALAADRGDAPIRGSDAAAKKAADERRALLEAAIRLDGRKKKYKKQQEVDLLAPNLNRDKVQFKAQMEREASKKAAQAVKDRDKAALDKQRADAAKAKADKQKKAQKQERRA